MTIIKNMDAKGELYQLEALAHDTYSDWAESIFDQELGYCTTYFEDALGGAMVYEVWHFDEFIAIIKEYAESDREMTTYYLTPLLPAGSQIKF